MLLEAIEHRPEGAMAHPLDPHSLLVRIRVKKSDAQAVGLYHGDRYQPEMEDQPLPLEKVACDGRFDWWEGVIPTKTRRVRYTFWLEKDGKKWWMGEKGVATERREAGVFQYAYICDADLFEVPDWAQDAVVYQIFPERFANGDPVNDPEGTLPWEPESRPQPDSFYGGDLAGVIAKMSYLRDLGINTIYLTPIFLSPSNHKYNTDDYYRVDPHFGDVETVKELVRTAHAHGIRVLFDAVFNHSGSGFFAYQDVLEKGADSPYRDWFRIDSFPVVTEPSPNYETFANGIAAMPKLMTHHPEVRDYLLDVAEYWTREAGIDGWRLDVANEVDFVFWRAFRERVRAVHPEALIVGEVWHDPSPWLRGDQFDSVMNYGFRDAVVAFFAARSISADTFAARLAAVRMRVPRQANQAMFNLLGSHDTERFFTLCGGDKKRMKLAVLFQLTYEGIPMIYYGDEVGMEGGSDPDCRRPMIWDSTHQDRELFIWHQQLLAIRSKLTPLRRGDVRTWVVDTERELIGYLRQWKGETVGIVLNNSPHRQSVTLDVPGWREGTEVWERLSGLQVPVDDGRLSLSLSPGEGAILSWLSGA
jgi:cyclomaltodextrinase